MKWDGFSSYLLNVFQIDNYFNDIRYGKRVYNDKHVDTKYGKFSIVTNKFKKYNKITIKDYFDIYSGDIEESKDLLDNKLIKTYIYHNCLEL